LALYAELPMFLSMPLRHVSAFVSAFFSAFYVELLAFFATTASAAPHVSASFSAPRST